MIDEIKKSNFLKIILVVFAAMTLWWLAIFFRGLQEGFENNAFTLIYPLMSLIGGIAGLLVANHWGGFKSVLGKTLSFFALGLLAQFLGQAVYAYYIYILGVEVPYPSLGDVGYFGSVIFYILGALYLTKLSGLKFSVKSLKGKLATLFIPLIALVVSYFFFLKDYQYDWGNKLNIFLDFGYPFGQAIYVSIAIVAFLMCRRILGGIMKKPISLLIGALVIQYFCDFMFLYQASRGTWYVGGFNDYLYFVSYCFMTLVLVNMGFVFNKINES